MGLSKAEIEQIVEAKVKAIFSQLLTSGDHKDIEYLPTAKAYLTLGYSSQQKLRDAISDRTLRLGIEVQDRRSPDSSYASYYFNIPACIKRLNTPPEKRA